MPNHLEGSKCQQAEERKKIFCYFLMVLLLHLIFRYCSFFLQLEKKKRFWNSSFYNIVFDPLFLTGGKRGSLKWFPQRTVSCSPIPVPQLQCCGRYHPVVLLTDATAPATVQRVCRTQNPPVRGTAHPLPLQTQMGPCWVGSNLLFLTFLPEMQAEREKSTILIRSWWEQDDENDNNASSRAK